MRSAAASGLLNHCGETKRGAGQKGPTLTPNPPQGLGSPLHPGAFRLLSSPHLRKGPVCPNIDSLPYPRTHLTPSPGVFGEAH